MKDLILLYKLYLQIIINMQSLDEAPGDKELLKYLKNELNIKNK